MGSVEDAKWKLEKSILKTKIYRYYHWFVRQMKSESRPTDIIALNVLLSFLFLFIIFSLLSSFRKRRKCEIPLIEDWLMECEENMNEINIRITIYINSIEEIYCSNEEHSLRRRCVRFVNNFIFFPFRSVSFFQYVVFYVRAWQALGFELP